MTIESKERRSRGTSVELIERTIRINRVGADPITKLLNDFFINPKRPVSSQQLKLNTEEEKDIA